MSHIDDGKLNAMLDGELEEPDRAAVQAHIAVCPECAKRFEEAKRFLAESADLLGALEPPAVVAPGSPPRRVTRTVKERALDVDDATQQSPAIRPEAAEPLIRRPPRAARPAPERRFDPSTLSWAAMIVLAIGVGYLANEVRHAREARSPAEAFAPPATAQRAALAESTAAGVVPASRARDAASLAPAGSVAKRAKQGPPAAKAPPGGGEPPVAGRSATGLGHKVLQPSARPVSGLALQAPARPSPALDAAASGAAGGVPAAAPPAVAGRNAAAPRRPRAVAEGGADSVLAVAPRDTVTAGVVVAPEERGATGSSGFRSVTLEEAVASLGGTIRLVDGMQIDQVQIGPGRLVAGADSTTDVVRVTYADAGRTLLLDQQRIESAVADQAGRAERRADEVGAGDTVLTVAPDGWRRVRWLDRDGFWLSLSGHIAADTLRALVQRVR